MNEGLALVRSGQLLYTDDVGKDACGIGGIAAKDGKPTTEVLRKALTALKAMEHRGGICGDAGDGAGLTCQLPLTFFREQAQKLKFDGARDLRPEHPLAVGVVFTHESDSARIDTVRGIVREVLSNGPVALLGFRAIPTNDDVLPPLARQSRPGAIEQVVLRVTGDVTTA